MDKLFDLKTTNNNKKLGYSNDILSGTCIDVDECIEDNGNCSNICINLLGSYLCACETGYELDVDKHSCIDVRIFFCYNF